MTQAHDAKDHTMTALQATANMSTRGPMASTRATGSEPAIIASTHVGRVGEARRSNKLSARPVLPLEHHAQDSDHQRLRSLASAQPTRTTPATTQPRSRHCTI
jgi:hypothetical protein